MFRYYTLKCRLKYIWTEYVEDILTLLDSCNDRSLFLFQVWGPAFYPLPNYTWTLHHLELARFCEGLPIFLRFVSAKAKPNIYSAGFLPGSEGKHRFFFKVLFCFHEKSDFEFSYGDLPKISLNCKTAVLQIFLNFETEILSSQREFSFCCADISLTVRKLLLI